MTPITFSIKQRNYVFTFKKGFSLLCLFLFVLCCTLGVWQVKRYHYKTNLLNEWQQSLNAPAKPLATLLSTQANLQLQHAAVRGQYVNELTMFVQDQIRDNKVGYEVLTPLQIKGEKKLLLIDRGWIETADINVVPQVSPVQGEQRITGHIKLLNEYQFMLGDNILQPAKKPLVMQKIEIAELERVTQQAFFPFVLRLDADNAHGFVREWVITNMMPQRHMAYAVQWFALALVLLIAWLCFCCERYE